MKAEDKLRVFWSKKQKDVMFFHPLGSGTSSDARYLNSIFNVAFTDELTSRGYDISTLRFSIEPRKDRGDKFAAVRPSEAEARS